MYTQQVIDKISAGGKIYETTRARTVCVSWLDISVHTSPDKLCLEN